MEKSSHSAAAAVAAAAAAAAAATCNTNLSSSSSSSGSSAATSTSGGSSSSSAHTQSSLKALNKASYKISRPVSRNPNPNPNPAPARPPPPPPPAAAAASGGGGGAPPLQPQPPVYNIDKSDFRDVVQKLTGSPAHHQIRPPQPPPAPAPGPAQATPSRLHRIRPPPLAHLSPRPQAPPLAPLAPPIVPAAEPWTRPLLSPLPPLPAVSAAAESPISAYMRRLRAGAGIPALGPFPAGAPGAPAPALPPPPSSPLGFGCLPSPRTAYQMMTASSGLLTPSSPGVPMPSPRLGEP